MIITSNNHVEKNRIHAILGGRLIHEHAENKLGEVRTHECMVGTNLIGNHMIIHRLLVVV